MSDFEKEISGQPADDKPFRDRELEAMTHVLATRSGRRLVYDLLGICHFGRAPFAGENAFTAHTLIGKQMVGEHIMGLLNLTNPEAYTLMVKEAKEDAQHDNAINDRRTADASSTGIASPDRNGNQPR